MPLLTQALKAVVKEEEKMAKMREKAGQAAFTGQSKDKEAALQAVAEESLVPEQFVKRREWSNYGECHLEPHAEGDKMKTWQGMLGLYTYRIEANPRYIVAVRARQKARKEAMLQELVDDDLLAQVQGVRRVCMNPLSRFALSRLCNAT
jgi:hypothetical protein